MNKKQIKLLCIIHWALMLCGFLIITDSALCAEAKTVTEGMTPLSYSSEEDNNSPLPYSEETVPESSMGEDLYTPLDTEVSEELSPSNLVRTEEPVKPEVRTDNLDQIVHDAIYNERQKTYFHHTMVTHELNLPKHNAAKVLAENKGPFFGSYLVPADGKEHGYEMLEISDIDITARYTGTLEGELEISIFDSRGKKLLTKRFESLWKLNTLSQFTSETLEFTRPKTGTRVLFKIGIEEVAFNSHVSFGIYRPSEIICGMGPLSKALVGYSQHSDLSEKDHNEKWTSATYPSSMMSPVKGMLMYLSNILDTRTDKEIAEEKDIALSGNGTKGVAPEISGPSMRWANGRYEMFRWTWCSPLNERTFPVWGYVAFDRLAHRWFKLNSFRLLRNDVLPTAWLFKGGLFVLSNGFCSDLRVYRLTAQKGVESFRVPTDEIRGHMIKIARLFSNTGSRQEHPRIKPVSEGSIIILDVKPAGPFNEDLDLTCLIETENGNRYDAIYTIRNGRLIGTSATKRD